MAEKLNIGHVYTSWTAFTDDAFKTYQQRTGKVSVRHDCQTFSVKQEITNSHK